MILYYSSSWAAKGYLEIPLQYTWQRNEITRTRQRNTRRVRVIAIESDRRLTLSRTFFSYIPSRRQPCRCFRNFSQQSSNLMSDSIYTVYNIHIVCNYFLSLCFFFFLSFNNGYVNQKTLRCPLTQNGYPYPSILFYTQNIWEVRLARKLAVVYVSLYLWLSWRYLFTFFSVICPLFEQRSIKLCMV